MTTTNIRKGMAKGCTASLVFLCLWVMVPSGWAAYEVNSSNITADVLTSTPTRWTGNLTVRWTAPTMTGNDVLNGYIFKWNNSSARLDDTVFNANAGFRDGIVDLNATPPNVMKSGTDLLGLDSGDLLYLHIKTWYLDNTNGAGVIYSDDVAYENGYGYGPFMIDNVAPTGTIRIVDASGINDVTSTSDTIVYLKLAASRDPIKVYLSETPNRPVTGSAFSVDAVYGLGVTTPSPPDKTIYAWFEDSVGNVSSAPATDSFTLLAPINISPNSATLATGATQVFRVEGTSATYNWSIINEKDPNGTTVAVGTIATITVGGSGTNSVTVLGKAKGTFQLQAGALTSGTITVVQNYIKGDVNNSGTITPADAAAAFQLYLTKDWTELTDFEKNTADFNSSGSVTPADAAAIFQLYLNQ